MAIFATAYLGILLTIFPYIIPFKFTIYEAASSAPALSLMLIGVAILLPIILAYTAFSYYVFRGKTSEESLYN